GFFEDFFDRPPKAGEAKPLAKETCAGFEERLADMETLAAQISDYPFLTVLADPILKIREVSGKEYGYYLTDLFEKGDMLLNMKENLLDPVFRFMSGPPKAIYDEARTFLMEQEANFSYLESNAPEQISDILADKTCFENNRMQQVKTLVDALRKDLTALIEEEKIKAQDAVRFLKDRMASMNEYQEISQEHQYQLNLPFDRLIQELERQNLIAVIRDRLRRFEDAEYQSLLAQMCEFKRLETEEGRPPEKDGKKEAKEPKIDYISGKKIRVAFSKPWLADEIDVDSYLGELKKALMREIDAGKRIQI
ncbi:MAG: BREX system P-loop protein BrxC, partial [Proteobacteria bacterium]|nr:BREX system P-loop protein BrxC [Pseudomonadota bacterium]